MAATIFSRTERNLLYARTDMGGAYRFNTTTSTWIPLQDDTAWANQSYWGTLSLATDPVDPARVYLATGLYTSPGSAGATVLFSDHRGDTGTWTAVPLQGVALGGNEDGRNAGERLAVDGNNNTRVYLGTSRSGLYRSVNRGVSWARIAAWPGAESLTWVLVDDTTATSTIYAACATGSPAIFSSTNGGDAWTAVVGQPVGLIPIRHALDRRTRVLYLTYADHLGPNGMTTGAVHRFDIESGAWSDITPPTSVSPRGGGFAGVAVDAQTSAIMVTTMDRWCVFAPIVPQMMPL